MVFTSGISSYLVDIVDAFLNQFAILLLIAMQCIIFGWSYGAEKLIPILNNQSTLKIGVLWKNIIKYILPVLILIMWIIGIVDLFRDSNSFKIMVDISIIVVVLILSIIFYKTKTKSRIN